MPTAIRFGTTGPIPQVLHLVTVPFPTPSSPTTSIVRIRASAINPSDVKNVTGTFPETTVPRTPGRDFAGVIVEGEGKGKRVWGTGGTSGFDKDGTHAQYFEVPSQAVQEMPANLSFEEAASCGVAFLTASLMLERAGTKAGENVLVLGSSGSVGSAAVQLARSMGANPLESSRRAQNDRTVDISKEALDADIDRITGGSGVAVVLDTVSDPVLFTKAMQALGNGGRYVLITRPPGPTPTLPLNALDLYRHDKTLMGVNSVRVSFERASLILGAMKPGFETGKLLPPRGGEEVNMTDEKAVVEAYERVERGARGKMVLVNGEGGE